MTEKNEALRLADAQDCVTDDNCGYCMPCSVAAELRRLHAENDLLASAADKLRMSHSAERMELLLQRDEARRTVREAHEAGTRLQAQRDALLEALKEIQDWTARANARAAIAAVEGEKT
jgi:hypothetical protein